MLQSLTDLLTRTETPLWFSLVAPAIVLCGVIYTAVRTDKRELVKLRREQIIKAQADIFFNAKVLDDLFADLRTKNKKPADVLEETDKARREMYRATMAILSIGNIYLADAATTVSTTYGRACTYVARNEVPSIDLNHLLNSSKALTAAVRYELGMRNRVTIRERIGRAIQKRLLARQVGLVDAIQVAETPSR